MKKECDLSKMKSQKPPYAKRAKLSRALEMFREGEISAGFACEFSGVDRYRFYEECAKHKIPVIHYEAGELEAELEALLVKLVLHPTKK